MKVLLQMDALLSKIGLGKKNKITVVDEVPQEEQFYQDIPSSLSAHAKAITYERQHRQDKKVKAAAATSSPNPSGSSSGRGAVRFETRAQAAYRQRKGAREMIDGGLGVAIDPTPATEIFHSDRLYRPSGTNIVAGPLDASLGTSNFHLFPPAPTAHETQVKQQLNLHDFAVGPGPKPRNQLPSGGLKLSEPHRPVAHLHEFYGETSDHQIEQKLADITGPLSGLQPLRPLPRDTFQPKSHPTNAERAFYPREKQPLAGEIKQGPKVTPAPSDELDFDFGCPVQPPMETLQDFRVRTSAPRASQFSEQERLAMAPYEASYQQRPTATQQLPRPQMILMSEEEKEKEDVVVYGTDGAVLIKENPITMEALTRPFRKKYKPPRYNGLRYKRRDSDVSFSNAQWQGYPGAGT